MLPQRARRLLSILFAKNLDLNTPGGRSQDRYRRAAWTSLTLIASRVVNIATGLATIPLTFHYLGKEQFGLWMTLTSFVSFLNFSDFGLGEGLQNALIQCYGRNDYASPKSYVSAATTVLGGICLGFVGVAVYVFPMLPWSELIPLADEQARTQLLPTAQAMCIGCGIGLVAALVQRVSDGYQRGYIGWALMLLGRTLGFVGVVLCIWRGYPLWVLAGVYITIPHIVLCLGGLALLVKVSWLIPAPLECTGTAFRTILSVGGASIIIRAGYISTYSAPALIVANQMSAALVGPLSVAQKLVGTVGIITASAMSPLRNSYGEAAIRGDWAWIERTLGNLLRLILVVYLPTMLILALFGRQIVLVWTRDSSLQPSFSLLFAYETYFTFQAFTAAFSGVLYSLNRLRCQAVYYFLWSLAAIGLSYAFATELGVAGIIWCVAVCEIGLCACTAIDVHFVLRRRLITIHRGP